LGKIKDKPGLRHTVQALLSINSLNFHTPVKTGGIEIGKVKDHRLKPAALKLEEYKRKASEHHEEVKNKVKKI